MYVNIRFRENGANLSVDLIMTTRRTYLLKSPSDYITVSRLKLTSVLSEKVQYKYTILMIIILKYTVSENYKSLTSHNNTRSKKSLSSDKRSFAIKYFFFIQRIRFCCNNSYVSWKDLPLIRASRPTRNTFAILDRATCP